jgi:hypothetical protein
MGVTFDTRKEPTVARGSRGGRQEATLARVAWAVALVALALTAACGDDESPSASGTSTQAPAESVAVSTVEELPDPVGQTRAAILAAASAGDYDALGQVVDPEVFLSDAGFGVDPVPHWRDQGAGPLEAMAALLAMTHTVRETNEGTLFQWPRFTADSDPDDMSAAERDALTMLLGERGLERAFQSETGYIAPRLGILDDGTWWSFVTDPAP